MAEEDTKEEGEQAAETKSNKKLFIIIGAGVALVLLIVTVLLIVLLGGEDKDGKEAAPGLVEGEEGLVVEGFDDEDELEEDEEPLGALFPMKTFVVNLSGGEKFLRVQIQVEFKKRSIPRRFYSKLVPCRDRLIQLLASRAPDELSGQKGKETLKEDIRDVINETLKREEVKTVYFTQFVVQ